MRAEAERKYLLAKTVKRKLSKSAGDVVFRCRRLFRGLIVESKHQLGILGAKLLKISCLA